MPIFDGFRPWLESGELRLYIALMHKVAILALKNVVPLDFVIPLEIFSRAQRANGEPCYQVKVCGPSPRLAANGFSIGILHSLSELRHADTIVIPGTEAPVAALPLPAKKALLQAHARGARILSICSGAFHLAETGLLDGRTATTHWLGTADLARLHPKITVKPDVIYVDEGSLLTSAGACAGLDLCLHVVRKDFGSAVAAHSARLAVTPLERRGGQAQFIERPALQESDGALAPLLEWIEKNLAKEISLGVLSKRAGMSPRTLNRQFQAQTSTSPLQWILNARLRRARELLETTRAPMERIALRTGFGSAITMREHFRKNLKISPKAYRESFQK